MSNNKFDDALISLIGPLIKDAAVKALVDMGTDSKTATTAVSALGTILHSHHAGDWHTPYHVCQYCNGLGILKGNEEACEECLNKANKSLRSIV